jgi:hypothetical protein
LGLLSGDENEVGNVPMCADPMGLQWMMDIRAKKPKPTNTAPGLIYMLCGATQHSNTDPFDRTSPAIPIGPHWMIIWPYDAKRCGLPNTVRDAGAWVMFDGIAYAYLHICGTPISERKQPDNPSINLSLGQSHRRPAVDDHLDEILLRQGTQQYWLRHPRQCATWTQMGR